MAISDSQRQFGEKNRLRSDFEADDCGTVALCCLDLPCTQQVPPGLSSQSSMTLRSLKYQHLSELKGSIGRLDVQCLSGNVSSPCRCSSSHVSVFSSRSYRAETVGPGNIKVVCILPLDQSRWGLSSQASDRGENSPHCKAFQGGRLGGTGRAVTGGYSERHLFAMSQQKLIVQRKAV